MEIKLEANEAAIVFRADGAIELTIPDRPGKERVPVNVLRCVKIATALRSEAVIDAIEEAWGAAVDADADREHDA